MRPIGFSTGALAKGDYRRALAESRDVGATAVELSALRWEEPGLLCSDFASLALMNFRFVTVHLPSRYPDASEREVVDAARRFVDAGTQVVVHPDVISDSSLWESLGEGLLLENMDKRKSVGRTAAELRGFFVKLPRAGLCLDVGHARQVDPSLAEAVTIIEEFGARIRALHVSDVASSSLHEPLSDAGLSALTWLSSLLPSTVPAIIESPVSGQRAQEELGSVMRGLNEGNRLATTRAESEARMGTEV